MQFLDVTYSNKHGFRNNWIVVRVGKTKGSVDQNKQGIEAI